MATLTVPLLQVGLLLLLNEEDPSRFATALPLVNLYPMGPLNRHVAFGALSCTCTFRKVTSIALGDDSPMVAIPMSHGRFSGVTTLTLNGSGLQMNAAAMTLPISRAPAWKVPRFTMNVSV